MKIFTLIILTISLNASVPKSVLNKKNTVVTVYVLQGDNVVSSGSGFMISKTGLIATNFHVIKHAVNKPSNIIVTMNNGSYLRTTQIYAYDKKNDVAIIRTSGKGLQYLNFSKQKNKVGDKIYVIGSPLGLESTLSDGIISSIRDNGNLLQITAPISSGSSGSPVLDKTGNIIAIVTSQIKRGQNLNFSVNGKYVRSLLIKPKKIESTNNYSKQNLENNPYEFISDSDIPAISEKDVNQAMDILKYLAHKGDKRAQGSLVMAYEGYIINNDYDNKVTIPKDYKKAYYWAKKLADNGGNSDAYYMKTIGDYYYKGQLKTTSKKERYKKAFYWYKKAAEKSDENAALILGDLYFLGQGTKRDYSNASKWYQYYDENQEYTEYGEREYVKKLHLYHAIRDNESVQLFNNKGIDSLLKKIKTLYKSNKIPTNYKNGQFEYMYGMLLRVQSYKNEKEALELFKISTQKGSTKAIYEIGNYFSSTYNQIYKADENKKYGKQFIKESAKKGYGYAGRRCAVLYNAYSQRDKEKALECAKLGASNNDNLAIINLVSMLDSKEEKIQWLKKLHSNKNNYSEKKLGEAYYALYYDTKDVKYLREATEYGYALNSYGVYYDQKEDYNNANYWYRKAIKRNNDNYALRNLGMNYEYGLGVLRDYKEAVYYYNKAIMAGSKSAKCDLAKLYIYGWGVEKNNRKAKKLAKMGYEGYGKVEKCKKLWDDFELYKVAD